MTVVLAEVELEAQVGVRGDPPPGFPTQPNTSAVVDGRHVLWLGPDEWLVLGGRELEYAEAGAAVDVSANRIALSLAGPHAGDVLAQGCSIDLHPAVFTPGRCAQTLVARAQVILYRPEADLFLLLVRPSFGEYLQAWLQDAMTDDET